jgi:hypothetical protein
MNNPSDPTQEELMSALFLQMILQQSNMALIFLGKVPNPETGEFLQDLAGAKYLIDQLEMIEVKTRGNLSPEEATLLNQTLTGLRMAFVEVAEKNPAGAASQAPEKPQGANTTPSPAPASPPPAEAEESRKKFTKKY